MMLNISRRSKMMLKSRRTICFHMPLIFLLLLTLDETSSAGFNLGSCLNDVVTRSCVSTQIGCTNQGLFPNDTLHCVNASEICCQDHATSSNYTNSSQPSPNNTNSSQPSPNNSSSQNNTNSSGTCVDQFTPFELPRDCVRSKDSCYLRGNGSIINSSLTCANASLMCCHKSLGNNTNSNGSSSNGSQANHSSDGCVDQYRPFKLARYCVDEKRNCDIRGSVINETLACSNKSQLCCHKPLNGSDNSTQPANPYTNVTSPNTTSPNTTSPNTTSPNTTSPNTTSPNTTSTSNSNNGSVPSAGP